MKKIILDLCGGTGSWSLPYKEAGYEVYNITFPNWDVRTFILDNPDRIYFESPDRKKRLYIPLPIYGVLSAPPCTMFSFARTKAKIPRNLPQGMEIVEACLKVVWILQYLLKSDQQKYPPLKFWALENPYFGMLRWFLGKPAFIFNPYEFGHNYQKKTAIWGYFNKPIKKPIKMTKEAKAKAKAKAKTNSQNLPKFDYMKSKDIAPDWFGKLSRQDRRAITPEGFALAFYKANK